MITITLFMCLVCFLIVCLVGVLCVLISILTYFAPILFMAALISLPFVILHERKEQRNWIAKIQQENEEWLAKVQQENYEFCRKMKLEMKAI